MITREQANEAANELVVRELLRLVRDLADHDPCAYDHDDMCRTHALELRPCPHERARERLTPEVLAWLDRTEVER